MPLPKAVQKQAKASEKAHAEAYAEQPIVADPGVIVEPSTPTLTTVEDAPPLETPPAASPVSEVPQVPPEGERPVDWEHKYSVLKGKYDAEVPRLQADNNSMQGRMGELENRMHAMAAQSLETVERPPVPAGSLVTPEEIDDYGEDMIDVVRRTAREEFAPMLQSLQTENDGLRQVLGGLQQKTVQDSRQIMLDTLDSQVTNWREINGNDHFLGWLENVDPYSGQKKLEMLRAAFEGNNSARVLAFFKGYLNENAAFVSGQGPNTSDPTTPQVNLDTLVAPGRPADVDDNRAQEGNANKRTWTGEQISGFYRDVQRGVYRDKPDERAALEGDIFLAQSEGRII